MWMATTYRNRRLHRSAPAGQPRFVVSCLWRSVLFVHTKTQRPAGRCFQMPGGALGPGIPPGALPLPKNPEEYRKMTKYTEESRNIPENTEESRKIPKSPGGEIALPGSASETRAMIRKPTITTGWGWFTVEPKADIIKGGRAYGHCTVPVASRHAASAWWYRAEGKWGRHGNLELENLRAN